jgi:hypothetical protein
LQKTEKLNCYITEEASLVIVAMQLPENWETQLPGNWASQYRDAMFPD